MIKGTIDQSSILARLSGRAAETGAPLPNMPSIFNPARWVSGSYAAVVRGTVGPSIVAVFTAAAALFAGGLTVSLASAATVALFILIPICYAAWKIYENNDIADLKVRIKTQKLEKLLLIDSLEINRIRTVPPEVLPIEPAFPDSLDHEYGAPEIRVKEPAPWLLKTMARVKPFISPAGIVKMGRTPYTEAFMRHVNLKAIGFPTPQMNEAFLRVAIGYESSGQPDAINRTRLKSGTVVRHYGLAQLNEREMTAAAERNMTTIDAVLKDPRLYASAFNNFLVWFGPTWRRVEAQGSSNEVLNKAMALVPGFGRHFLVANFVYMEGTSARSITLRSMLSACFRSITVQLMLYPRLASIVEAGFAMPIIWSSAVRAVTDPRSTVMDIYGTYNPRATPLPVNDIDTSALQEYSPGVQAAPTSGSVELPSDFAQPIPEEADRVPFSLPDSGSSMRDM